MFCKKCGYLNKDDSKFCENCGARLDVDDSPTEKLNINEDLNSYRRDSYNSNPRPSYEDQSRNRPNNYNSYRPNTSDNEDKKKLALYGLVGVLIVILLAIVVKSAFFSDYSKNGGDDDISEHEENIRSEDEEAKSEKSIYKDKLDDARRAIMDKDYEKAMNLLDDIPADASADYKLALKEKKKVEMSIVEDLNAYIEAKDYSKAKDLSDSYLALLPDSEDIWDINLKASEQIKKTNEEKSKKIKDMEKSNQAKKEANIKNSEVSNDELVDLDELRRNNSYGENGNPKYTDIYKESDFLHKSFRIMTDVGMLREGHSLNSRIIGKVYKGDVVYVEDCVSDGERYWCYIGDGWISTKLFTGEYN